MKIIPHIFKSKKAAGNKAFYQVSSTTMYWILASLISVILPHALRMPVWLLAICLVCIVASIQINKGKLSFPGRKLKTLAVIVTFTGVLAQYGKDIFSTDAIVSVLLSGVALKLMEMKQKRDVLLVIYLCYFSVLAEFIYSQTILVAIYMALCIVIITATLMSLAQRWDSQQPARTAKLTGIILLQSIPLMLALFILFPRISPLWSVPIQNNSATTGLSDEMSLGTIGDLTRSGEVAFTVQFDSSMPPLNQLYWRGITLDRFNGKTWRRSPGQSRQPFVPGADQKQWHSAISKMGKPVSYNIIMEPTQQNYLFTLKIPNLSDQRLYMQRDFQVRSRRPITQRYSYNATSWLEHTADLSLSGNMKEWNVRLPQEQNLNPLSKAFMDDLVEKSDSEQEIINSVLAFFREQPFYYTLTPQLLGENAVDDFLFTTREGFCEHYASTFTYLMRLAGIPARVVTGYQGGEFNPYNDTLIVRQYDAHAWAEVWLEGKGWVRVDPTAAVSPNRIEYGSQFTLQEENNFLDNESFSLLRFKNSSLIINDLIFRFEMIDYAWNRFVLNYNQDIQMSLFRQMFDEVTKTKILVTVFGFIFICLSFLCFHLIRSLPREVNRPVNKIYLRFCNFLAQQGMPRHRGEAPKDYCTRVCEQQPSWADVITEITESYYEIAFGNYDEQEKAEKLEELKSSIRKFKLVS